MYTYFYGFYLYMIVYVKCFEKLLLKGLYKIKFIIIIMAYLESFGARRHSALSHT